MLDFDAGSVRKVVTVYFAPAMRLFSPDISSIAIKVSGYISCSEISADGNFKGIIEADPWAASRCVSDTLKLDFLPLSCVFCSVWLVSGVPQSSWGDHETGWFDLCLEKTGFRSVCRQNEVSSCWPVSCLTHWPTGHHFLSWWKLSRCLMGHMSGKQLSVWTCSHFWLSCSLW